MRKSNQTILGTLVIIGACLLPACGRKAPLRIPPAPALTLDQPVSITTPASVVFSDENR